MFLCVFSTAPKYLVFNICLSVRQVRLWIAFYERIKKQLTHFQKTVTKISPKTETKKVILCFMYK